MTQKVLIILNISALLGALIWLLTKPEWEPLVTAIGLIAALIAQLYPEGDKDNRKPIMRQKGGKGSINLQSNNSININTKGDDKR